MTSHSRDWQAVRRAFSLVGRRARREKAAASVERRWFCEGSERIRVQRWRRRSLVGTKKGRGEGIGEVWWVEMVSLCLGEKETVLSWWTDYVGRKFAADGVVERNYIVIYYSKLAVFVDVREFRALTLCKQLQRLFQFNVGCPRDVQVVEHSSLLPPSALRPLN